MPRRRKEIEEEEESGTTRCVCGHEELQNYATRQRGVDPSLFIQCDQCEAWQHGFCVGLTSRDVPDVYYCEECRPEFHEVRTKKGRITSQYNPHQRRSRRTSGQQQSASSDSDQEHEQTEHGRRRSRTRRQTMNSREDDILQRVLEQSAREAALLKKRKQSGAADDDKEDPETEDPDSTEDLEAKEETGVANGSGDPDKPDEHDDKEVKQEGPKHKPAESNAPQPDEEMAGSREENTAAAAAEEEEEEQEGREPEKERSPTPPPATRKRKRRAARAPAGRSGGTGGPKPQKAAQSTTNGKKSKPKIPSPRATFTEMRKRVAMILEYSGHTQSEMMAEETLRSSMLEEQRKRDGNQPVISQLEGLYSQHKQNISQLEGLTEKLLAWQEKYG